MMLNTELVRRRRLELGFSLRDFAARLGVSSQVISALEAGTNHHTLSLAFIDKLATLLSTPAGDLFDPPVVTSPVDASEQLVLQLGTLLGSMSSLTPVTVLSQAAGVSVPEVAEALDVLADRLDQVGLTLHRLGNDVEIRPAVQLDVKSLRTAQRRQLARRGMTLTEARLLYRIRNGGVDEGKLSNPDRVALQRLRVAGIVDESAAATPVFTYGAQPLFDE